MAFADGDIRFLAQCHALVAAENIKHWWGFHQVMEIKLTAPRRASGGVFRRKSNKSPFGHSSPMIMTAVDRVSAGILTPY